jgi:hypothetical protein
MKTFVGVPSTELNRQRAITRAETMLAELITELNLPLTSSDTFNKAVKLMFPDSKIAEGIYSLYFSQVVRENICSINFICLINLIKLICPPHITEHLFY